MHPSRRASATELQTQRQASMNLVAFVDNPTVAPTVPTTPNKSLLLSGYLQQLVGKTWRRRYFELEPPQTSKKFEGSSVFLLRRVKSGKRKVPEAELRLTARSTSVTVPLAPLAYRSHGTKRTKEFCFVVSSASSAWTLCAENEQEKKKWVTTLRYVSAEMSKRLSLHADPAEMPTAGPAASSGNRKRSVTVSTRHGVIEVEDNMVSFHPAADTDFRNESETIQKSSTSNNPFDSATTGGHSQINTATAVQRFQKRATPSLKQLHKVK